MKLMHKVQLSKKMSTAFIMSVIAVFVMGLCFYTPKVNAAYRGWDSQYTGMYYDGADWIYVENGQVNPSYTGMACNFFGWWYFNDGKLDWTYTGEAYNVFGAWFYENGRLNWDANGMIYTGTKWRMANGGHIDTGYTGMANNWWGWWYFVNGDLDFNYTGMASNVFGWWYYTDGNLNWTYTGEGQNVFGLWFYDNGRINWDANGACLVGSKWRMVSGGHIEANYTGMANNLWGWWYFTNGEINWTYTGIGENVFGIWYYENGRLNFDFTGDKVIDGITYHFIKGHVEDVYYIMGGSYTSVDQMVRFFNSRAGYPGYYVYNGGAPDIWTFCQIYWEECVAEGVRPEVAFCQAMLETGYLSFSGHVCIEAFNFAGIGAVDSSPGSYNWFTDVRTGIRAQVQHLKAYASTDGLVNPCVDPRFHYVSRGCSPYVESLGGRWASGADYGNKIRNLINALLSS